MQVLSSLPWPVPAEYWRYAWSLRGCQHHDQDAGMWSILKSYNAILHLFWSKLDRKLKHSRRSRTCPTCAGILRSRLFPRLPTSSLNCFRWFCHHVKLKIEIETETERRSRGNLCDREFSHDLDPKGHQGCYHRHLQPGDLMSTLCLFNTKQQIISPMFRCTLGRR